MDLIEKRFNDWDTEVIGIDYQISLLLRQNLNNALDSMIPDQSHLLEKVHTKTHIFRFTDHPVLLVVRDHHWNNYKEYKHG